MVYKVIYCAGPENLQRALNEMPGNWSPPVIFAHAGVDPRYTVILAHGEKEEGDSPASG